MIPFPNNNSELMGRLQAFLPAIAKANKELEEKIKVEGAHGVRIDLALEEIVEPEVSDHYIGAEDSKSQVVDNCEDTSEEKVIELNFALGDFDDSPLVKIDLQEEENSNDSSRHIE